MSGRPTDACSTSQTVGAQSAGVNTKALMNFLAQDISDILYFVECHELRFTKGQSKSSLLRLFSHLASVASTGTGLEQHNTSGTNTTRYASKESPQV